MSAGQESGSPIRENEPCSRRRYRQTRPEGRSPPPRGCLRSGYPLPSTPPRRHSHPDCRAVLTLIVEQRLARWLAMCHDRLDGNELPLTHEFLGIMIGVRRASVTEAIQILENKEIISARRGAIEVLDRAKLEATAAESYGVPEAEYRRIIGPL